MKFIACADLHFTLKTPRNRTDNYFDTQLMKFSQILELAENENAGILVAGDIFDSFKTPYEVTKAVMDLIKEYGVNLYMVAGQHDLVYHSEGINKTPLGMLSTMKQITLLSSKKRLEISNGKESVTLIGAGWEEEPEEHADIVVMHKMVIHKKTLWAGQKDYSTAASIMKKYSRSSFIISGDNHLPFFVYKKGFGQSLINCGSLTRSSKAQLQHKPVIWLIDTEAREVEEIKLKIQPYRKVFNMEKIKREKVQEEITNQAQLDVTALVESLNFSSKERPKFENILNKVIKEINPEKSVIHIINTLMEKIKQQ